MYYARTGAAPGLQVNAPLACSYMTCFNKLQGKGEVNTHGPTSYQDIMNG